MKVVICDEMRILLVDEDKEFLDCILSEVEKDYVVDIAHNGTEGTSLSQINDYDVMVVSDVLSDMNGFDVCKEVRIANVTTPIIYLSNTNEMSKKVVGLDSGADVYLVKPVSCSAFKAQIRALIRRKNQLNGGRLLEAGDIKMDLRMKVVSIRGEEVKLRRKEYDLLEYLMLNKNNVVSKEEILEHVWEKGIYVFSNTVEVHIRTLREKLYRYGVNNIRTVRGFGYKFEC